MFSPCVTRWWPFPPPTCQLALRCHSFHRPKITPGISTLWSTLYLPLQWKVRTREGNTSSKIQLIIPIPPLPEPLHNVNQAHQHGHLDQRAHSASQRLPAPHPINSDHDGNGEFEIIARGRETLRAGNLIPEPEPSTQHDRDRKHDGKVHDQRRTDA